MTEVHAHQRLDATVGIVAGTAQGVGDALLKLVGQHIGVAARFDVQQRADAQQELLRFLQRVSRARAFAFERLRMQRAEIARDGDVAKAARGALDVRFQLIERVIELRVALIDQLEQRLDHALALATRRAVVRTDAVEERDVSGNRSCVEQSHQELGILQIRIVMVEVTKLSHLVTDDELQVPERLQHGVDESFLSTRRVRSRTRSADRRPSAGTAFGARIRRVRRPSVPGLCGCARLPQAAVPRASICAA